MNIAMIGGGSIGLLFGYYLSEVHNVNFYVRTHEQAEKIMNSGLFLQKGKKMEHIQAKANALPEWSGDEDLTIVAVKQYHLPEVVNLLKSNAPEYSGSFLFLQNGMGHLKWINQLKADNVYVGSVEHGAYRTDANIVRQTGLGRTKLALFKGSSLSAAMEMAKPLTQFPFSFEDDYYEMLLNKLVVNSVVNPLTAILRIPNGELLANPFYHSFMKDYFSEISACLDLKNKEKSFANVEEVCKKTAENRSSMLKDIEENRQTEIDAILGFVLEKAKENKKDAPLTAGFYQLIKGKEYKGGEE
jgi:2-dehydropantoate 2-reductase